jgi:hypothetical protein
MNKLLRVYRLPAILLFLLALPGVNSLLWFNPHGLPLVGLVLVNCLPLCTIYVLFCLARLHRSLAKESSAAGFWRQALLSLVIYLVLLVPISFLTVTSLNLGKGAGSLRWDSVVFYKVTTFPIGLALPPYGTKNRETLDFMRSILKETILKP